MYFSKDGLVHILRGWYYGFRSISKLSTQRNHCQPILQALLKSWQIVISVNMFDEDTTETMIPYISSDKKTPLLLLSILLIAKHLYDHPIHD